MDTERKILATLKRSPIGRPRKQRETLRCLGLNKLHKTVELQDSQEVRGMLAKVIHLLDVRRAS